MGHSTFSAVAGSPLPAWGSGLRLRDPIYLHGEHRDLGPSTRLPGAVQLLTLLCAKREFLRHALQCGARVYGLRVQRRTGRYSLVSAQSTLYERPFVVPPPHLTGIDLFKSPRSNPPLVLQPRSPVTEPISVLAVAAIVGVKQQNVGIENQRHPHTTRNLYTLCKRS